MNNDYLNNLIGSPYIDEGVFDRLKARGAAGIQRYKGFTSTGWNPIDKSKLESLYNSFYKKIHKLLTSFYKSDYKNIKKNKPSDITLYQTNFNELLKLATILKIKRHQRLDTYAEGVEIIDMLYEANFSNLRDPWSIQQARLSNNTITLLNAYASELRKMYDEFINDVKRIFKIKDDSSAGSKIVEGGVKYKKILNAVEGIIGVKPSEVKSSGETPEEISPTNIKKPSEKTSENPSKVGAPPEPPAGSPAETSPKRNKEEAANIKPGSKEEQISKFITGPVLVSTAKVIIDVIKSDANTPKRQAYFTKDLSQWKQEKSIAPSSEKTSKFTEFPVHDINEEESESSENEREGYEKGKFFHTFMGLLRKHGGNFLYTLGSFNRGNLKYVVQWHNKSHENNIVLNVYDPSIKDENPHSFDVFKFYDHDVNPTSNSSKNFNIIQLFQNSNPHLTPWFTENDIAQFKTVEPTLQKALFLVTSYKNKEHKTEGAISKVESKRFLKQKYGFSEDELKLVDIAFSKIFDELKQTPEYADLSDTDIKASINKEILIDMAIKFRNFGTDYTDDEYVKLERMRSELIKTIQNTPDFVKGVKPSEVESRVNVMFRSGNISPNASESELITLYFKKNPDLSNKSNKKTSNNPNQPNRENANIKKANKWLFDMGIKSQLKSTDDYKKLIDNIKAWNVSINDETNNNINSLLEPIFSTMSSNQKDKIKKDNNAIKKNFLLDLNNPPSAKELIRVVKKMVDDATKKNLNELINPYVLDNFI